MPDVAPSTPAGVVAAVLALVHARTPEVGRVRLALDGAPAAEAHALADAVAAAHGRAVAVRAEGFWRPAGQRLEHGRHDTHAWLHDWLDHEALQREVLRRVRTDGTVVPALRDPATDRSARRAPVAVPDPGLVVVSGSALLQRPLDVEVVVHLAVSARALERRLPEEDRWTVEALQRYARDARPAQRADLVVRAEDPRHPALEHRSAR